MKSMVFGRSKAWGLRIALIALTVLVSSVGFCLFDHHDGDHVTFDLCLGMLVTSLATTLISLALTGSTAAERLVPVLAFSPRVPVPPPRTRLSS